MSTWISRAALVLLLAACVPDAGGSAGPGVKMVGGALNLGVPRGYCLDAAASHDDGSTAVMIMGPCAQGGTTEPSVITATVGDAGSSSVLTAGAKALSAYFTSPQGRAALARDGRAASVHVVSTAVADGVLVLHLQDRNVGEYWRAIMGLRGRLVTVSVTGAGADRVLLDRVLRAMRAVNPATAN